MAKRRIHNPRPNPWNRKDQVHKLDEIKRSVPWYFSDMTWDDYMLCVAWVVLKYVLYSGEEWSMMNSEKEMNLLYKSLMSRATKNDKKFIGVMSNLILELGGYYERE